MGVYFSFQASDGHDEFLLGQIAVALLVCDRSVEVVGVCHVYNNKG